jgi:recombination protein RecR
MYPKIIRNLIETFSRFPTVGPRTAARFVFYLRGLSPEQIDSLTQEIQQLKRIQMCELCFAPDENPSCSICSDSTRLQSLCIVEKESDFETIEKTKSYRGTYFILGGTVGSLRKSDIANIRSHQLKKRVLNSDFNEIIIATNPTTEGEATAMYLERLLHPLHANIKRLGRGLPIGAELEYADDETLRFAFLGRR